MKQFILNWAIMTIAILVVAHFVEGIHYNSLESLVVASLVFGILNLLIRPILIILTLPLTLVTFGLFIFVLNGILFYFVGALVEGIYVDSLMTAVWGALFVSIVSWLLNKMTRPEKHISSKR
ncbi:MAG: phage holin family protein [Calditrichaeota bacterium]|nr:MAG: phage holin family protein [Calditrichota bacterium]